jgi:transposase
MRKRKDRKKADKQSKDTQPFQLLNSNAAGIDIGSEYHYVAVPSDRDEKPVRRFACFTADIHNMAEWLKKCGVETIAMESTGVYWIPPFQILESYGFDVKLVNAREVKNMPGRKTDVQDCQWLQQLHTYGLLRASFRPENSICIIRNYLRQRDSLVKNTTTHINRMQKALIQMNVQLYKVISDITGFTGMRIIKAILDGERDPHVLASLKHYTIKNSVETIARSLEGDYREELLFVLRQELEIYEYHLKKIQECDQAIEKYLAVFDTKVDEEKLENFKETSRRKSYKFAIQFNLQKQLYRITGVDLTKINGCDALTVQTVISETGIDMSRWKSEKHFASWLGLCPHNKITGGKVIDSRIRNVKNRAAIALRLAARSAGVSNSALGAFYRRIKARDGAGVATAATAHKISRIFYSMLKYSREFEDFGAEYYEKHYKERVLKNLQRRAKQLGFSLIPSQEEMPVSESVS